MDQEEEQQQQQQREQEQDKSIRGWFVERWRQIVQENEREGVTKKDLERLEGLFDVLSGKKEPHYDLPSIQLPYGFYLPKLPTRRFYTPECRSWRLCQMLEAKRSDIVYELLALLPNASTPLLPPDFQDLHRDIVATKDGAQEPNVFCPYIGEGDGEAADMVRNGSWDVFYFFRDFVRQDRNCSLCPVTSSLLDQLISEGLMLGGMVCFSALKPSTRILPHYGPSNMRSLFSFFFFFCSFDLTKGMVDIFDRLTCHLGLFGCEGLCLDQSKNLRVCF